MQIKYYDHAQAKKYLYFLLNTHKFLLINVKKVKYIFFLPVLILEKMHIFYRMYIFDIL